MEVKHGTQCTCSPSFCFIATCPATPCITTRVFHESSPRSSTHAVSSCCAVPMSTWSPAGDAAPCHQGLQLSLTQPLCAAGGDFGLEGDEAQARLLFYDLYSCGEGPKCHPKGSVLWLLSLCQLRCWNMKYHSKPVASQDSQYKLHWTQFRHTGWKRKLYYLSSSLHRYQLFLFPETICAISSETCSNCLHPVFSSEKCCFFFSLAGGAGSCLIFTATPAGLMEDTTSTYKPLPDFPAQSGRTPGITAWDGRDVFAVFWWGSVLRCTADQQHTSLQGVSFVLHNNIQAVSQVYLPACLPDLVSNHPEHTKALVLFLHPDSFPKVTRTSETTQPHHPAKR